MVRSAAVAMSGFGAIQMGSCLTSRESCWRSGRKTIGMTETRPGTFTADPLPVIESKLSMAKESGGEYALTGFSAAARLAPMVRYQRASAYVIGNIEELANPYKR